MTGRSSRLGALSMTTISARSILASHNVVDPNPHRVLHSILARYPLTIHQELLTHRAFTRNSASSRAIPIERMIKEALDDPAIPTHWTRNQPGMQGYEYLDDAEAEEAKSVWLESRDDAVKHCRRLAKVGLHKQVANRLLGPYIHITTMISATEWSNFFGLRTHITTEPHMRDLANVILAATETAQVLELQPRQWHMPWIKQEEWYDAHQMMDNPEYGGGYEDLLFPISVARCASTSYKTVDDTDMTATRAHLVYKKLITEFPVHASPTEHVAQADAGEDRPVYDGSRTFEWQWIHQKDHRNFVGFRQLRANIPRETL